MRRLEKNNKKRMSRREFITAASGALAFVALGGFSCTSEKTQGFVQPPLPYPEAALEPVISSKTMSYHYGKHHKGYVDKLNKAISGTEYARMPFEKIILQTADKPEKSNIFNNAAQAWNHVFYWNSLSPDGGGNPPAELEKMINISFESFSGCKKELAKAEIGRASCRERVCHRV